MENYYFSANDYYRTLFNEKVYKISLNAGMSCPNRDGTLGSKGCIFCSAGGSGDFAADSRNSITEQIDEAILRISNKYNGNKFIAYFQAFTNTYSSVDNLRTIFYEAINNDKICGLSIATRPDCLEPEKIQLLAELNSIKPVWVELGLQTINETTANYIRRGYTNDVFEKAVFSLINQNIPTVVHMIVGLPGETREDFLACAKYLSKMPINGIKIQLLHVLKHTDLEIDYNNSKFTTLSLPEYASIVVDIIELLPKDFVVYRITGDGPKDLLIAPLWSTNKKNVLNTIKKEFKIRNTYQGRIFHHGS